MLSPSIDLEFEILEYISISATSIEESESNSPPYDVIFSLAATAPKENIIIKSRETNKYFIRTFMIYTVS